MPIHPEIQKFLEAQPVPEAGHIPALEELRMRNKEMTVPFEQRPPVFSVEDMQIPLEKRSIAIRVYTPEGQGPFPLFLYFHGGGFVLGNLDTHDVICRKLANSSQHKVVSVDYRLAPESPFPAALEDCYAALEWLWLNGDRLDGDSSRISIGGDSAGGNLAAAVCIMARDRQKSMVSKQVLLYPVIDHFQAGEETVYDSYYRFDQHGLSRMRMSLFWQHYLKTPGRGNHPYASPIRAESLQNLPACLVITAEYDILRDEGERYAERLKHEGTPVFHKRIQRMNHGFLNRFHRLEESEEAFRSIAEFLNQPGGDSVGNRDGQKSGAQK
ncbi:acetyl esterase [Planomicrobium soli]|uniref:Acetyl esterase n=1 Tax=Planomicrobium soli TaxID=1176648 RepID=A0A2P8H3E8_9BACL|nr:alpha/beta hydrolase [Planomicrobium soli]PSL40730.1 acetyl esterase [Planomicrobium soli]